MKRQPNRRNYLLSKMNKKTGPLRTRCWIWHTGKEGRAPTASFQRIEEIASRMSFKEFNGEIPKDKIVRHKCDNPKCINPKHLVLGTKKQNRQDFMRRNPNAYKICIRAAKKAQKAMKEKWRTMSPIERRKFCNRRSILQHGEKASCFHLYLT